MADRVTPQSQRKGGRAKLAGFLRGNQSAAATAPTKARASGLMPVMVGIGLIGLW